MHIPDGFLDIKTCITAGALSISSLSFVIKKLKNKLIDSDIPKMGVISAFIFAAQMINFPVAFGTSGHLLGAALATLLLGPLRAVIILTGVVGVQAFVFQDGGISVLGANILNMAIIPVVTTYYCYNILNKIKGYKQAKIFFVSWISIIISALFVSLELAFSGTYDFWKVLSLMIFWHIIIGIGEGLITCFSYTLISKLLKGDEEIE